MNLRASKKCKNILSDKSNNDEVSSNVKNHQPTRKKASRNKAAKENIEIKARNGESKGNILKYTVSLRKEDTEIDAKVKPPLTVHSDNVPASLKQLKSRNETEPETCHEPQPKRRCAIKSKNYRNEVKGKLLKPVTQAVPSIPPDIFGFNSSSSDADIGGPIDTSLTEFDCSKPFRAALYIKPSRRLKLDATLVQKCLSINPNLTISSSCISQNKVRNETTFLPPFSFKSPTNKRFKLPISSTPKERVVSLKQKKITDAMPSKPKRTRDGNDVKKFTSFFENSDDGDNDVLSQPLNPQEFEVSHQKMLPVSKESNKEVKVLSDDETLKRENFRKPVRRSYGKKARPIEPVEDDPSSDEILKSIEKSRKKTKTKKLEKQDQEFEVWSRSINSQFDEIDKFEISFD